MADGVTAQVTIDAEERDLSDHQQSQRSLEHHSTKGASSPNEATLIQRPDALTTPLIGTHQGSRNLVPALPRLNESILSHQIDALKVRLAIDEEHCGARTLGRTACRLPSPAKSNGTLASILRGLTTMTQSSEELDSALGSLAPVVHCHHHESGPPIERGVDEWVNTFPRGADFRRSGVVLARKMRKALGEISSSCAGWKNDGTRCKARVGGQQVQNSKRSIDELVKTDDCPDRAVWELLLSVLEANRYCQWHPSQPSMQNVRRWLAELWRLHHAAQPVLPASSSSFSVFANPMHVKLALSRKDTHLQIKINAMFREKDLSHEISGANPLPWLTSTLIEFWISMPNTPPSQIVSHGDLRTYNDPFQRSLRGILAGPLDAKDCQEGYVYVYEVEGRPRLVKIGYTTRTLEDRHREWSFDCNRKTTLLYPLGNDAMERVPNASIVEALCHAKLQQHRRRFYCTACLKQHIEWFEVETDQAIQAIRHCTLWMKKKPYRTRLGSGMVLAVPWEQSLVNERSFWTMVSDIGSLSLKD